MKRIVMLLIVLMITCGLAYAEGGKIHSEKGKGSTHTGSTSKGASTQKQLHK